MTREDMIKMICEGVVKNAVDGDDCRLCFGYQGHNPECPYVLSERILAEPVFDVGDTVMFKESKLGIVKNYSVEADESLVGFDDGIFWTSNQNLTLVRKGGNDSPRWE